MLSSIKKSHHWSAGGNAGGNGKRLGWFYQVKFPGNMLS